jgi:CHRD domain
MRRMLTCGVVSALVGALAISAVAFGASAKTKPPVKKFSAALNVGQETGVVKSTQMGASGRFTASLSGTTLTFTLTFTHLSGAATAAHIHGPAARHVSAGVLVPLCGPCTSPVTKTVTLTQDQINLMQAGKTYVNVHTGKNPNGEIRGQIVAVG